MKVDKKLIYNKIMLLNKEYLETKSPLSLMESAVLLGLYYGLDGKKRVAVDPHYSAIVTAVSIVVQIKEKMSNNADSNISLISKIVAKETSGNVTIRKLDIVNNAFRIMGSNLSYKDVVFNSGLNNEKLCEIAHTILQMYNNLGVESMESKNIFQLKLREILNYAG